MSEVIQQPFREPGPTFGIAGVCGYVAPRHLMAMKEVGGRLLWACDERDGAGVLDGYFPEASYSVGPYGWATAPGVEVEYVAVCVPNWEHLDACETAMEAGADVICEKPLVVDVGRLDGLRKVEEVTGQRVWSVLQMRHHEGLVALRTKVARSGKRAEVEVRYISPRGPWYWKSWKGDEKAGGGLEMNIGVHLFDLLLWIFGPCEKVTVTQRERATVSGELEMEKARVRWSLSVDQNLLPPGGDRRPVRSIWVDGESVEFDGPLEGLHTEVYRSILAGRGLGIDEAEPSLRLVDLVRRTEAAS